MGVELEPAEVEVALAALLHRKLVQVIDDAARDHIVAMLDADPAIGPIDGLPDIGSVQFTAAGVTLSHDIARERDRLRNHPKWFTGVLAAPVYDGNRCTIYSVYLCQAVKFAQELESYQMSMPEPIGPWRCHWYEKYPCGFRVECEFPDSSLSDLDTSRGRQVLDEMLASGRSAEEAMRQLGIAKVDESELEALCQELVAANPKTVADIRAGNAKAAAAFIGQAKKRNPNVDPRRVQEICLRLVTADAAGQREV